MECSGAGGKLIDEKNQKRKISWHCPFKERDRLKTDKNQRKEKKYREKGICH